MSKILVTDYVFNATSSTIVISGEYNLNQLLLITNVTRNEIIYSFADPTLGAASTSRAVTISGIAVTYASNSNVVTVTNTATIKSISSGWDIVDANLPGGRATVLSLDVASNKLYISKLASAGGASTASAVSTEPNRVETLLTLTFNASSAGHASTDKLQIFADTGATQDAKIIFPDRFIDPVDKIRVSTPQSMIDTDFEYGTQPSRWETVSSVLNYPSVFPKGVGQKTNTLEWGNYAPRDERGFNQLDIYSIQCGASSKTATVHCRSGHGLNIGDFVYIIGGFDAGNIINNHFFVQSITNISFTIQTLGSVNV